MLLSNMNLGIFDNPETVPYTDLIENHAAIQKETKLAAAALEQLDPNKNDPEYTSSRELLDHGNRLLKRYKHIRGDAELLGDTNLTWSRDHLFILHASRISLTFARLDIAKTLSLLSFEQMAAILDSPVAVQGLYFFSVAFLGARLVLNVIKAAKHAIDPSPDEARAMPSGYDRFMHELNLVSPQILNDIVWGGANALTNYPQVFGLSNPAVNIILLTCLTFDLGTSAWGYYWARDAYLTKQSEYHQALENSALDEQTKALIYEELKQLKLAYIATAAQFQLYICAGLTIFAAFSLIASSALPFFFPLGAALCVFGTSLYLSADKFGAYRQKVSLLDAARALPEDVLDKNTKIALAEQAKTDAQNDGLATVATYTAAPLLFMTVAASIGWPLALVAAGSIALYNNMPDLNGDAALTLA